jgi:signal transduction histidine kinase/ActR/RegA family two-component response regulator
MPPPEAVDASGDAADRNREWSFRALIGLAVVVPTLLFVVAAWYDHDQIVAAARRRVVATADAMAEQAEKVLETNELVLSAVSERIRGLSWAEVRASEPLHAYLQRITTELPQLESTFVIEPTGVNSSSSRAFPMKPFDVTGRDYFQAAQRGETGLFISAPFAGQQAGTLAFTVTRPASAAGLPDGLVGVTLSPAYFEKFYAALIDVRGHPRASLLRGDGVILVRYPAQPGMSAKLGPESFLLHGGAAPVEGLIEGPSALDGHPRLGAIHAVAGVPLFVGYSVETRGYLSIWWQHIAVLALFAIVLIVVLSASARAAIRYARRERANLRMLLAEKTRREEAEEAVRQLQKIEALGRLTGGVAHDFNNLLTAIMGSLELARKRVDEPRVARLLDGAMEASKRGARLTQQMLAFSRQQTVQLVSVWVNDCLRAMDDLLRRSLGPEIRLHYEPGAGLWPALADPTQLEVAILNLAINARDAMPHGGALTLRTSNVAADEARPAWLQAGEFVCVGVSDEGEGMTEEVRRRAVEPFYTTKGVGHGTGLGLSMAHGFALQTGGALTIDSVVGKGTTVRMFLPRAATLPELAAPPVAAQEQAAPLHILLVDDDDQVRALTAEMLRDLGHEVTECADGASAVARAAAAPPDLMIVDYAMPAMNGGEVARAVNREASGPPILFISGYAEADALQEWTARGYRLLSKPFSAVQLAAAIAASARVVSSPAPSGSAGAD